MSLLSNYSSNAIDIATADVHVIGLDMSETTRAIILEELQEHQLRIPTLIGH